jgi:hypothetical protein
MKLLPVAKLLTSRYGGKPRLKRSFAGVSHFQGSPCRYANESMVDPKKLMTLSRSPGISISGERRSAVGRLWILRMFAGFKYGRVLYPIGSSGNPSPINATLFLARSAVTE